MQKLQFVNAKSMSNLIQAEISNNNESRYHHRLHGVLLVAKGHSCSKIADYFDHSVKTIENWVNRFNKGGFEALRDENRTGRTTTLSDEQLHELSLILRKDPKTIGYDQNLWDGKLLSYHIETTYGITISVRQCQRLFHKLGFRQRKPRPISSKLIPKNMNLFKKTKTEN